MIDLPTTPQPEVTVVVVGLGDAPLLMSCLESIAAHPTSASFELRIALSDPTPRLVAEIQQKVRGAIITTFRANLGFAGSVNFAVGQARGDFIALLTDDSSVRPGWLDAPLDMASRRPSTGLIANTLLHVDGSLREAGSLLWSDGTIEAVGDGRPNGYMNFERRIDCASLGLWLVRRELWEDIGGLDEGLYAPYYEEVDFCLRAAEARSEIWYQPEAGVIHVGTSANPTPLGGFLLARGRRRFSDRWQHVLGGREPRGAVERGVWAAMGRPLRVLVIDDDVPDPSKGSGFGRMHDALGRMAAAADLHVGFYPQWQPGNRSSRFPVPGVRLIGDLAEHLQTDGVDYDVVVVSRPPNVTIFRDLVDRLLPDAKIIYDAEALFHRRLEMKAALAEGDDRMVLLQEAVEMRECETSAVKWADRVVCISEAEAAVVRTLGSTPVEVVGPLLEDPLPTPAGFESRADIGFVAGWTAGPGSPNCDALLWFVKEVLPEVRLSSPACRVLVTGANPPADVAWLSGYGVEFLGSVSDLFAFYNGIRVAISPNRFGAGVKLKTIEAVQFGVPAVCTTEGAAGLPDLVRPAIWVTDEASQFANAVTDLISDSRTWKRFRQACLDYRNEGTLAEEGVARWPSIVRSTAGRCHSIDRRD